MLAIVKKLIKSLVAWYVYFPHVGLLRLVGPRCASLITRVLSYAHWLLVLAGMGRGLRRTLARVVPVIHPGLSIAATLRRHLVVKHQCFLERQLCPTARGRRFVRQTYTQIEGREHLDRALAAGRGVILLGYHLGMGRMKFPALHEMGYNICHHKIEDATHTRGALGFVVRAILAKQKRDDEAAGLDVILHQPGATFERIAQRLRANAIVGIAGDGAAGAHFVDVPFLGGTMAFATGPARLAARTGAPIVPMVCLLNGLWHHRLIAHRPIHVPDDSPPSLEAAVREHAGLLEQYIRRHPWEWWVWRRLEIHMEAGGKVRFEIKTPPPARHDAGREAQDAVKAR